MSQFLRWAGLRKQFDGLVAVNDVSGHIDAGETNGLLGPNGAGNTTALSMTAGLLQKDAGDVFVAGRPTDHAAQ